jgi:predicted NUDIX family phosphoesterase
VNPSAELVLVVPRDSLVPGEGWHGLRVGGIEQALAVVAAEGRFMPRMAMEGDPSFKQVIPYVVLRDGPRWFLMQRTRAGGDARLHDRWSIGVGGHLNPGDLDVPGGLRREWAEELAADFLPDFEPIGLLNDDTTPVGQVHLGVVYVAEAAGRPVAVREVDKLRGSFVETTVVASVRDRLETWSRLVFDALPGRDRPTGPRASS